MLFLPLSLLYISCPGSVPGSDSTQSCFPASACSCLLFCPGPNVVWLYPQGPPCWKWAGTGSVHHPARGSVLHRQLPGRHPERQEWSSLSQALRFLPWDSELAWCSQSGKATGWPVRVMVCPRSHYLTDVRTLKSGLHDSKVHVCSLLEVMINTGNTQPRY